MPDLRHWLRPTTFTCASCCAVAKGSVSASDLGEPVDCLPPGWLMRRDLLPQGRQATHFACSAACAVKIDLGLEVARG
jgi:hypothetical protein